MIDQISRIGKTENQTMDHRMVAKDENIEIENKLALLQTDSSDEKTTPNTRLVLKKVYNECGHTINEYAQIPAEMVNKTQEEIEDEYPEWKVTLFSIEQLELEREVEGTCNQHYVLREKNGIVVVYKVNSKGDEYLKEETDIATEYLSKEDLARLKEGIQVYGEENLNALIEDFE